MKHICAYGYNFKFTFAVKTVCYLLRAECAGFTATRYQTVTRGQGQYAFEVKLDNFSKAPGTLHSRFPNADRFSTPETAALECDFWKYVLTHNYRVKGLRYSHGSESAFLDAATSAGLDVKSRADDWEKWGLELQYFVGQNENALSQCRDVGRSDCAIAHVLAGAKREDLRTWAQKRLDAEDFRQAVRGWDLEYKIRRLECLLKYEGMLLSSKKEVQPLFKVHVNHKELDALSNKIESAVANLGAGFYEVRVLLGELKAAYLRAETECEQLDKERPQITERIEQNNA